MTSSVKIKVFDFMALLLLPGLEVVDLILPSFSPLPGYCHLLKELSS